MSGIPYLNSISAYNQELLLLISAILLGASWNDGVDLILVQSHSGHRLRSLSSTNAAINSVDSELGKLFIQVFKDINAKMTLTKVSNLLFNLVC